MQAGNTRERQVGILLDNMSRRTDSHFKLFISGLVNDRQEHLAEMLDMDIAQQHIRARNLNQDGSANGRGTVFLLRISRFAFS